MLLLALMMGFFGILSSLLFAGYFGRIRICLFFSNGHNCAQEIVNKDRSWTGSVLSSRSASSFSHPKSTTSYWSCLEEGYVKLNTDGNALSSRNCVSVGGVIRDANGD